jgi:hypothetical protein
MAAGAAAARLPPLSDDIRRNDSSLHDPELQDIFVWRREALEYWIACGKQMHEMEHSQVIFGWVAFRAIISQGKMINFYLKKREELMAPNLTDEVKDGLYAHAYMALAAVYLTRLWSFNNIILGKPMFDAGPNLLATLRDILEKSDRMPGGQSFHRYNRARLWAFYVGAFGEQLNATLKTPEIDPCQQWFNKKLAEQAYITDVKEWNEAKDVFKGFLYTDHLPPHGSTWFGKTLKLNEGMKPVAYGLIS